MASSAIFSEQLELLNDLMKETSSTGNQFAGRFIFGGLVAVLALLNVDLVLLDGSEGNVSVEPLVLAAIAILVLGLSYFYFSVVTNHYTGFRQSHRKLKYKLELTLHALLTKAEPAEYASFLERSVAEPPRRKCDPDYPESESPSFREVAEYLLEHHRHRYRKLSTDPNPLLKLAMVLVLLTLAIRLLGLLLIRPPV